MSKLVKKKLTAPVLVWFYGRRDSGKTTTMQKVAKLLRPGCKKIVEHRFGSDSLLVCQYGSYSIGINTRGDDVKEVASGLERFVRLNLDICISCARPRFEKWKNKVANELSVFSRTRFNGMDVMEIPRWVVGSSIQQNSHCKNCTIISTAAEDLFYLIVRLMKIGFPKKWPEGKARLCLSNLYWNVTEKGVW